MLRRRETDVAGNAGFRSALGAAGGSVREAAWAVEERVVWGSTEALRGVADAARWPFERVAWALERGLIWPLAERTGKWNGPLRGAGLAALALAAVGVGVLGFLWASSSGGTAAKQANTVTPPPAPVVRQVPEATPAPTAPVLHGAAPDFTPEADSGAKLAGDSASKGTGEATGVVGSAADTPTSSSPAATPTGTKIVPAGPAATKVAHQFAGAFVLYETGKDNAEVREAFAATATPQLAHSLLQRPPRLPANVEVPKAKVLNVVPGPRAGDTYTLSVSLLRVGITSELRLDMQRDEKSAKWQVTDVRG